MTLSVEARETASLCHVMAHYVLPRYLQAWRKWTVAGLASKPVEVVEALFEDTCRRYKKEARPEVIQAFNVNVGALDSDYRYYVLQYPSPAPVGPLDAKGQPPPGQLLAPYFSAALENVRTGQIRYFVLDQAEDGGTTVRAVWRLMNRPLGRGTAPELQPFLGVLKERMAFLEAHGDKIGTFQCTWHHPRTELSAGWCAFFAFLVFAIPQGIFRCEEGWSGKGIGEWVGSGFPGLTLGVVYAVAFAALVTTAGWWSARDPNNKVKSWSVSLAVFVLLLANEWFFENWKVLMLYLVIFAFAWVVALLVHVLSPFLEQMRAYLEEIFFLPPRKLP